MNKAVFAAAAILAMVDHKTVEAVTAFAPNDVKRVFGVLPPRELAQKHYNKVVRNTKEIEAHNADIERKKAEKKAIRAMKGTK